MFVRFGAEHGNENFLPIVVKRTTIKRVVPCVGRPHRSQVILTDKTYVAEVNPTDFYILILGGYEQNG